VNNICGLISFLRMNIQHPLMGQRITRRMKRANRKLGTLLFVVVPLICSFAPSSECTWIIISLYCLLNTDVPYESEDTTQYSFYYAFGLFLMTCIFAIMWRQVWRSLGLNMDPIDLVKPFHFSARWTCLNEKDTYCFLLGKLRYK
jgi:hypothetical protein